MGFTFGLGMMLLSLGLYILPGNIGHMESPPVRFTDEYGNVLPDAFESPAILGLLFFICGSVLTYVSVEGLPQSRRRPGPPTQTPPVPEIIVPRTPQIMKPRRQRKREKKVTVGWCTVGATLGMAMILAALPCLIVGCRTYEEGVESGYTEDGEPFHLRTDRGSRLALLGILMLLCGPPLTYASVKGIRRVEREW